MTWTPPEVAKTAQGNGWVPPEVEKKSTLIQESAPDTDVTTKEELPTLIDEQAIKSHFSEAITPKTPIQSVSEGFSKVTRPLEAKFAEYATKKTKELTGGLNVPNPLTAPDPETFKADMDTYQRVLRENPMATKEDEKITAIGQLIQKTKETDAIVKDYESNSIAGNVGEGIKKGIEDYGRGYFELAKNLDTNSAVKDLSSKLERLDKGEDVPLDEGDKLLMQAIGESTAKAKQLEALDPAAFNIGKGAGTSIGFTGEFLLTGGLGAGVAKSIAAGTVKAIAEGATVSAAKRIGVGLSAKLAQTGIQVAAMPTFYKGIAEDVSQGKNFGESLFKNYYTTFAENFTERIFLKNPWNKSTVGAVDNFMGRLGVNMHTDKGLVGILASIGEEVSEEKIGEAMTAPVNYDNFGKFWDDYWNVKKNAELIGSVALMVAPMGIVSYSAKKWDDVQLNKVGKLIPGEIRSQLDEVLNDQKLSLKEQYDLVGRIVQDHASNQTLGENPAETAGNIIRYTQGKTKTAVVSAVEDRAKTPTIGEMEEITTEDQAKVDYLEGQGVKIPDGTGMTKVNEMYEAEKAKKVPVNVNTIDEEKDKEIAAAQKKLNLPKAPELRVSDETQTTLDKIDGNEPVTNEFIKKASDDLYAKYKELEAMKSADTRQFTTEQINGAQDFLGEEITRLENFAAKQAENEDFIAGENLSKIENISTETENIPPENKNILNSETEKLAEQKSLISESQPSAIQETEKSLQKEKPLIENEKLNLQKDEAQQEVRGQEAVSETVKRPRTKAGKELERKTFIDETINHPNNNTKASSFKIGKTNFSDFLINLGLSEQKTSELSNIFKNSIRDIANTITGKRLGINDVMDLEEGGAENTSEVLFAGKLAKEKNEIDMKYDVDKKVEELRFQLGDMLENADVKKIFDVIDQNRYDITMSEKNSAEFSKKFNEETKTIKEAAIKVADTLRKAKFIQSMDDLSKLSSDPTAILKVAWDGSVEAAAKTIELGGSVAQAVADGVKALKESEWYKKLSDESKKIAEERFKSDIETHLKTEGYATENGTGTPQTSQKETSVQGEDGGVRVRDNEKPRMEAEKGIEGKKKGGKVKISRYGTRVAFGEKTQEPVKEKYKKDELYNYNEEKHGEVNVVVDKFMDTATNEEALAAMYDNNIKVRIRIGIGVGLIKRYNEESDPLFQKGDKAAYDPIMDKIVAVHDFIQHEYATEIGRDMSYLGSNRVMELLGPFQTAELARRGMQDSRNAAMDKKSFKKTADLAKKDVEITKKKIIEEVIDKIVKPKESKVAPEIEKIRKERSSLIDKWKKDRKSAAYSAVIPGLTQADIEFIPQLAASYIKEGFYQTKVLVKKIQRILDQEGLKASDADLEALLPKEYNGVPLSEHQQAEDLKKASLSLARQIFGDVIDKKSPDSDPIVRMVKTLFSKFKETQLDRKAVEGMSDLEKLALAIREKDKYKSVWIEAKQKALDIIENNENLSDEQKETAVERIEAAYKNATEFTFSQKLITDLIKDELSEKEMDLGEVVRDHYESKDIIKADLVKSLVEKAGLDEKQAKLLADAVDKAFSTLMTARIQGVLKKYMEKSTRKTTSKQKKGAEEIVHLASIGAFENEAFRQAFADAWGLANLDDSDIKYIVDKSKMITKIKSEAIRYDYKQQLLAHIANMQGMDWDALIDGFWYANVLMGMGTQTKNFLDAATAATIESFLYSGTKPSQMNRWGRAYIKALKGRGVSNLMHTLRTGNHPFEFGTDAPKQAKRVLDAKEALVRNKLAWKGIQVTAKVSNTVFNVMMANDALWNTVAYESILDNLVTKGQYSEAGIKWWNSISKEQRDELNRKIDEIMKITPEDREIIKKLVEQESEDLKVVQAGLGEEQTGFSKEQFRLREYELMDEMRPKALVEEARRIAQMTLGNIQPYGTLGWVMSYVSSFVNSWGYKIYRPLAIKGEDGKYHFTFSSTESMTLRPASKIVPFTRIITSIAVRAMNWNPYIMAIRGATGQYGSGIMVKQNERFKRKLTDHEKKVLIKKTIVLATGYSVLYGLTGGDEPEDGWLRVTANGTGDWSKNKQLEASGWRPYSIQFGDFSISYQYIYPLNGILGAFGYARDRQLYKGADKGFGSFMKELTVGSVVSLTQVLFSTPMSGLNSMLDLMTNIFRGEVGTAGTQITKLLANIGGGYVSPRALKDMEATYDILMERSDIEGVTFWEKMSDKVPFVGRNFAGKVERLDMFGDPFKVKGPVAAVAEANTSRETSDLARWITEEIKYFRPIPDIDREKFILMERGGETDIARPLTGGSSAEEGLWTEYNRKLGQLFKEKALELKGSGDTPEEIKKEFELAWDDIVTEAKEYVFERSENHPLDKP